MEGRRGDRTEGRRRREGGQNNPSPPTVGERRRGASGRRRRRARRLLAFPPVAAIAALLAAAASASASMRGALPSTAAARWGARSSSGPAAACSRQPPPLLPRRPGVIDVAVGVGTNSRSAFVSTTTRTRTHRAAALPGVGASPTATTLGRTRTSTFAVAAASCSAAHRSSPLGTTIGTSTRLYASHAPPDADPWESAEPLTSTKSPTVKAFKALATKRKKRSELGLTVVEGLRLVLDGLSDPETCGLFRTVIVTRGALDHPELGGRLREGLRRAAAADADESNGYGSGVRVSLATEEVVKAAADTVSPQGVVATVAIPSPYSGPPDARGDDSGDESEEVRGGGGGRMYLLLDALSDPGNVGTLLRSSLASGVEAVLLLPGCCDVWNPKSVRSAMGAALKVPVRAVESWDEALELLKEWGVEVKEGVWAATMEGSEGGGGAAGEGGDDTGASMAHYDVDWVTPAASALIVGREGEGLSPAAREGVRSGSIRSVHVPMEYGVESLNAAVCGSVVLFERLRQQKRLPAVAAEMVKGGE